MASPVDLGSPALRSGAAASHYQAGPRTEDGGRARVFHCGKVPSPLPPPSQPRSLAADGGRPRTLACSTDRATSVSRESGTGRTRTNAAAVEGTKVEPVFVYTLLLQRRAVSCSFEDEDGERASHAFSNRWTSAASTEAPLSEGMFAL